MTFNKSKFYKINDKAFLYKNFISHDICDKLVNLSINLEYTEGGGDAKVLFADAFNNESSVVENLINDLCDEGICVNGLVYAKMKKNNKWHPHKDEMGYGGNDDSKLYGGVVYINDFDGGEIFYPIPDSEGNMGLEWSELYGGEIYKPNKGDLILHTVDAWHATKPNLSDERIALTFLLVKKSFNRKDQ
jgi:ectoine hydroxylase-related dioxygenase (phytanoyl-CoA dioxygenase family)